MTNYLCKFNYRGEVTELKTEANGHYQAILRCLAVKERNTEGNEQINAVQGI